ncbi:MAG: TonB-dependent receptor [Bdellovibrionota bacterium]
MINGQWAFYGRSSIQQSDGYRDHAGVSGHSLFFGGGYFSEKHILKFTAFTGRAKTALAYLAVPKSVLENQRTFNPLSQEEVDDFIQSIVMLEYATPIHDDILFSSTVYLNHADGNYTVWLAPDLYNFGLTSYFYGLNASLQYERPTLDIKIGLHANDYVRYHSAFIAPFQSSQLYKNAGHKNEMAVFVKMSKQVGRLGIFADMQGRMTKFSYAQDRATYLDIDSIGWHFFNPKAGLTWKIAKHYMLYASIGKTSREPTRNDMFAGFDNIDASNVADIGDFSKVKPETVVDYEAGSKWIWNRGQIHLNLYHMQFRNEIAAIGELSYIGLPLRKNVASSYRKGMELFIHLDPTKQFRLHTQVNLSRNQIASYTEDQSNQTYTHVQPLLTPTLQFSQMIGYKPKPWVELSITGRYTGYSYLDNTSNDDFTVPASLIFDGSVDFLFFRDRSLLKFWINNIANTKYTLSGYVADGESNFYPMARRNYYVSYTHHFQ